MRKNVRILKMSLDFSMVSATAIDPSGTECSYAESVNRSGITSDDIGRAVLDAIERLTEQDTDFNDSGMVILRFSHDT